MLQLSYIRDNREVTLAGLRKRHFAGAETAIDQVLTLDQQRRDTQRVLDETLARQNTLAKEIGQLMKAGQRADADAAKAATAALKTQSKELEAELTNLEAELQAVLVTIPNLPHASVPEGRSADDNEVVLEWGKKPVLFDGALPHWELIRKYTAQGGPITEAPR